MVALGGDARRLTGRSFSDTRFNLNLFQYDEKDSPNVFASEMRHHSRDTVRMMQYKTCWSASA